MSAQQKNITIAAPGFAGINSEISPTESADQYASIAENCIIDGYGRLGARKGFNQLTTDGSAIGGAPIISLHSHLDILGVKTVFSAADNRVFQGALVPVDVTPVGATITNDEWQMVSYGDNMYMFQHDHTVIKYTAATDTVAEIAGVPEGSCAVAANGRLWVAGVDGADNIVHWSDLLTDDFSGGDTGTMNVEKHWPTGYDTITGMIVHNDRLIVFGRNNILIYNNITGDIAGANGIELEDTVRGIGCIARDTIQSIGTDVLFLDFTGVRSLGRTLTQETLPIGDISSNVATAISRLIDQGVTSHISAIYSPEDAFYLLLFPLNGVVYCFDTRQRGQQGEMRVTTWPSQATGAAHVTTDGRLLLGGHTGTIGVYAGYTDAGSGYKMRYFTNPLSFGDSTRLKFPKQVDFTLIAGSTGTAVVKWAYDYGTTYSSRIINLVAAGNVGEYGIAEFDECEYTGGVRLSRRKANMGGNGVVVSLGIELDINGEAFSIQEINVQTLVGRIT